MTDCFICIDEPTFTLLLGTLLGLFFGFIYGVCFGYIKWKLKEERS